MQMRPCPALAPWAAGQTERGSVSAGGGREGRRRGGLTGVGKQPPPALSQTPNLPAHLLPPRTPQVPEISGSQPGAVAPPMALVLSGHVFSCHNWGTGVSPWHLGGGTQGCLVCLSVPYAAQDSPEPCGSTPPAPFFLHGGSHGRTAPRSRWPQLKDSSSAAISE